MKPEIYHPTIGPGIVPLTQIEARKMPSEAGVWLFVLGDMTLFALLFVSYALDYRAEPALFHKGQQHLAQVIGLVNTVLLLTGSLCVVLGLAQARKDRLVVASRYLACTILTGLAFLLNKILEYSNEISHGNTINSSTFFMYYYTLTMIHLVHVMVGMGVLSYLYIKCRKGRRFPELVNHIESGGAVWHMVDLLWIALFPLLYLIHIGPVMP